MNKNIGFLLIALCSATALNGMERISILAKALAASSAAHFCGDVLKIEADVTAVATGFNSAVPLALCGDARMNDVLAVAIVRFFSVRDDISAAIRFINDQLITKEVATAILNEMIKVDGDGFSSELMLIALRRGANKATVINFFRKMADAEDGHEPAAALSEDELLTELLRHNAEDMNMREIVDILRSH